jgi:glycosyltransferase involved in cell wall biosynthesis
MGNRVLMVAPTMFSADYGGATRIIEHVKAFRQNGFSVRLHTYAMQGNLERDLSISVDKLRFVPRFHQGVLPDRSYLDFAMGVRLLFSRGVKPSFIMAYNQEASLISKFANAFRVPVVLDVQGLFREEMAPFKSSVYEKLEFLAERKVFEFPSLITACSPIIAKVLNREFDVPSSKLKVLLDSADTELFKPRTKDDPKVQSMKAALGIDRDVRIVVYVGSFSSLQGTDVLLHAAQYVLKREKNVLFLLVGGRWSNNYSFYINLAKTLGISDHVKFLPGVDYVNDLPYLLNLADAGLAPKLFSLQSHGKLAVWMASGVPAVVWDDPINRLFLGSLGVYAKDFSAEAFGEAIIRALDINGTFSLKLRERAIRYFSLHRLTNDMKCISKTVSS